MCFFFKAHVATKAVVASDNHPQPRATALLSMPLWLISKHAMLRHPPALRKGTHFQHRCAKTLMKEEGGKQTC